MGLDLSAGRARDSAYIGRNVLNCAREQKKVVERKAVHRIWCIKTEIRLIDRRPFLSSAQRGIYRGLLHLMGERVSNGAVILEHKIALLPYAPDVARPSPGQNI